MKKQLLLLLMLFVGSFMTMQAQDVVLFDMESEETTPLANRSYDNGAFGADAFGVVDNPLAEGVNTSAKVYEWCKGAGAKNWAAVNFQEGLDFTGTAYTICMDVLMPHNGNVALKINDLIDANGDTITSIDITDLIEEYTGEGAWQQICFNGVQGDRHGEIVADSKFASFNLYFDFGNSPAEDECHYYDNVIQREGPAIPKFGTTLFDMETDETTPVANRSYDNGAFGADPFGVVENPLVEGKNRSANVWEWCKGAGAKNWAAVNYKEGLDFTGTAHTICMDVLMPHNGRVALKINDLIDMNGDTITSFDITDLVEEYTGDGAWQQICFNGNQGDRHGEIVAGARFTSFNLYFDFGNSPAADECHYFDNVIQVEGPPPALKGDVLVDWEPDGISVDGAGSFGNGHFGDSTFSTVANPLVAGFNRSDSVYAWCKANDAATWGGIYFDIEPAISLTAGKTTLCLDVLMPENGEVLMKIEHSTNGGADASLISNYTGDGQWQQVCFDYTKPDSDGDVGAGFDYARFTVFPNWAVVPAEDECYYIDNLTQVEVAAQPFDGEIVADWETAETTPDPSAFGDATIEVVDNPSPTSANNTANSYKFCKDENSKTWAGFNFTLSDTLDVTGDTAVVCVSVYSDKANPVRIKLEGATDGSGDVSFEKMYDKPGEWAVICYDLTAPGVDGQVAFGHLYTKFTVFPDFGNVAAGPECHYIDEIKKRTNGVGFVPQFIVDVITNSEDHSIFAGYISAADVAGSYNAQGVTVFAPTNAAIEALPATMKDALDNNIDNALGNFLMHHIVRDSLPENLLVDGTHIMRNGQDGVISGGAINGAAFTSSNEAVNGYVHFTDGVMEYPTDPNVYTLLEFEGNDEYDRSWYHWGTPSNIVSHEIIPNPVPGGINTSANVLQYKKYPSGLWYQGMKAIPKRTFNSFGPMTKVCVDLYTENDGELFLKWDATVVTGDKAGWRSDFIGGEWTTVCWDFTDENAYFADDPSVPEFGTNRMNEGMAMFFDTENKDFPADTVLYYLDNWRVLNTTVGSNDIDKLENFSMFPNPATDVLTIHSDTPIHIARIYDISGRMVMTATNPVNDGVHVAKMQAGLYLVDFYNDKNQRLGTAKFVKK